MRVVCARALEVSASARKTRLFFACREVAPRMMRAMLIRLDSSAKWVLGGCLFVAACGSDTAPNAVTMTPDPVQGSDPEPAADAGLTPDASPGAAVDAAPPASSGRDVDDAAPPPHPLAGRYAVRTVSYAKISISGSGKKTLDIINKGVLVSVADISSAGQVTERMCFLELIQDRAAIWSRPSATQSLPASVATLRLEGDSYVRSRDSDRTRIAWKSELPADCTADGVSSSSGCVCVLGDELPASPNDCRLTDPDGDGLKGIRLAGGNRTPTFEEAPMASAQIVAGKAIEWKLPTTGGAKIVGKVDGSVELSVVSAEGALATLNAVDPAACPSETGHVELVRGDFDCATLLAGRARDLDSLGLFDPRLDMPPDAAGCPTPAP